MSYQTLADQLGWCITSKDALAEFDYACRAAVGDTAATVAILDHTSFADLNHTLRALHNAFQQNAEALHARIQQVDTPYIQKQVEAIRSVLP